MTRLVRLVAIALVAVACSRGARTPDEALARLRDAAERGEAAQAFDLLDEQTRWSIESTWKYQQLCFKVIEEDYPGEAQAQALGRLIDADSPAGFFRAYEARYHQLAGLRARLATAGVKDFVRDRWGRYGYVGLREPWEDIKQRASKDLETVRRDAQTYQRTGRR